MRQVGLGGGSGEGTSRSSAGRGSRAFEAVICGGGIAGVEALLRIRRLLGDRGRLTLISPHPDLVCRPWAVSEPFTGRPAARRSLERIPRDVGAVWRRDRLESVDAGSRTIQTQTERRIGYDALLVAPGGHESPPYEHACVFTDRTGNDTVRGIVHDLDAGALASIAFVLPPEWVWPVPLYELALMTAARARDAAGPRAARPRITFITPEPRPLKAFGEALSGAMTRLLAQAGISLMTGALARVPSPGLVAWDDTALEAERIVTVPKITGRAIRGLPAGTRWALPIDDRCVVPSTHGRVFAAGDATDFPIKQGGIAAQQADTAAAGIAHLAGLGPAPPPLRPLLRGMILTGGAPLYGAARPIAGLGWQSRMYDVPPWPASAKIVAGELGRYVL